MDQHQYAFIEEAKELLPQLEEALLELEEHPTDNELINSVFRALHTIKGSGGMFGFEKIESFTHDLENAFELVRSGKFPPTHELIDLTLAARDEIQALVQMADEDQPDTRADSRSEILSKLQLLLSQEPDALTFPEPEEKRAETFQILFRPEAQAYAHGSDPLLLLNELRELGRCTLIPRLYDIPALDKIDPESCYIFWEIILSTTAGKNAIQDIFIFVEDDCELVVKQLDDTGRLDSDTEHALLYATLNNASPESGQQEAENRDALETPQQGEMNTPEPAAPADESAPQQQAEDSRQKGAADRSSATVRVPSDRLDKMVNLVGELVIAQARLSQLASHSKNQEICAIAEEIDRLTSDMRDTTMSMRMVPIGSVFGKYKRLVRDLARDLGKQVDIDTSGGETELDKTVIERLHDPMVHMIRNAIDHGIEPPQDRIQAGKPSGGRIHLSAVHSGAYVLISVRDDGAGLNRDRILAKAIERGLTTSEADLSDREIYEFILQPGFSTKQQVSAYSGRGVGMDVVARSIQELGGRVQIDSSPGKGSTIVMRLPLTLAIIDGLQIRCDGADYVLPVGIIEECVELTEAESARDRYRRVLHLRGEMVPYISLRELFKTESKRPANEKIVIINDEESRYGIVVDHVVGELQAVIKPLGRLCRDIAEVSGATILGDGTVALILDISRLFDAVKLQEESGKSGN
jgi:two-component system, chemotaxis family, sensor kinase CheA